MNDRVPTAQFSERFKFADWPNRTIPNLAAGVYAIWDSTALIYCGMSGREYAKVQEAGKKKYELVTRLASYASGRLSGDRFCVCRQPPRYSNAGRCRIGKIRLRRHEPGPAYQGIYS